MTENTALRTFHRIRSLKVSGGFLDGLHLRFEDNLNCLIGGRGTGKTTVLEILRWALGRMPDPKDSQSLYRDIDRLIKANLGNGKVEVEIETLNGMYYQVRKSDGDAALVMNDRGDPVEIDIERDTIFSAEIYSQNQIEEIAKDPLFQLKLIDKFVAEKIREASEDIRLCERQLSANASEIIKLRGDITTVREKVSELPEVTEKLRAYHIEEGNKEAEVLQKASEVNVLRAEEKRAVDRVQQLFSAQAERLREVVADLPKAIDELIDQRILGGPNSELLRKIKDQTYGRALEVIRKVEEAVYLAQDTHDMLQERISEISDLHLKQEKEYHDLLVRSFSKRWQLLSWGTCRSPPEVLPASEPSTIY